MANVLLWECLVFHYTEACTLVALSELYGLASDNILSLKAVIANGLDGRVDK